jgi:hypothetical protein
LTSLLKFCEVLSAAGWQLRGYVNSVEAWRKSDEKKCQAREAEKRFDDIFHVTSMMPIIFLTFSAEASLLALRAKKNVLNWILRGSISQFNDRETLRAGT